MIGVKSGFKIHKNFVEIVMKFTGKLINNHLFLTHIAYNKAFIPLLRASHNKYIMAPFIFSTKLEKTINKSFVFLTLTHFKSENLEVCLPLLIIS